MYFNFQDCVADSGVFLRGWCSTTQVGTMPLYAGLVTIMLVGDHNPKDELYF